MRLIPLEQNERYKYKCMVHECQNEAQIKKEIGDRTYWVCFDHHFTDGNDCVYQKVNLNLS
jgi:hypothetical protein